MGKATVALTPRDRRYLCEKVAKAGGGLQDLIRRLQSGIRMRDGVAYLTVNQEDIDKIPRYWAKTGGRPGAGGLQGMLPVESLREYLPTIAPLFGGVPLAVKRAHSYVYFKRQRLGGDGRIKIGRGSEQRASTGRSTDNPNELVVLLRLEETEARDETYWLNRFRHLRISPKQEWFWPGDDLMEFIHNEAKTPQHETTYAEVR